jgi:hypothetical protein
MVNEEQLALLESLNAHVTSHSRRTLLEHLRGTHDLLEAWGNTEEVCAAGLFHSIYGTYTFVTASADLSMRERVREVIGERAEWLVYVFCVTDRRQFYDHLGEQHFELEDRVQGGELALDAGTLTDLIEMEAANTVEQVPRRSAKKARRAAIWYGEAFEHSLDCLSEPAIRAFRRCFADVKESTAEGEARHS